MASASPASATGIDGVVQAFLGDDTRRAAISRVCFEIAEVLSVKSFADDAEVDVGRRVQAFRILAQVVAEAAGPDETTNLRLAEDWVAENLARLEGARECCAALSWVAAMRVVGIED